MLRVLMAQEELPGKENDSAAVWNHSITNSAKGEEISDWYKVIPLGRLLLNMKTIYCKGGYARTSLVPV